MRHRQAPPRALAGLLLVAPLALPLAAAAQQGYRQPPAPIAQILDAEPTPLVSVGPDRRSLLLLERHDLPSIAEVAAPELRLAGLRLDPRTNGRSRDVGFRGLRLVDIATRAERRLQTPEGGRIGNVDWSHDGGRVAFTVTGDSGIALWVTDVATGQSRQLTPARLNGALGAPCTWADTAALVCRMIPDGRGPAPERPQVPTGPIVQESDGRAAPNRTYQDLLESPADERLFEHYATSQIVRVGVDGAVTPIGAPGIHVTAEPSPDASHLLVETIHRPFSYVVPLSRFPRRSAVWTMQGQVVREVVDSPLQERVPIAFDAVATGPRNLRWRADAPATLLWVEALDRGDPGVAAEARDRLLMLAAPFAGEPVALFDGTMRIGGVQWLPGGTALVNERWWKTRMARVSVVDAARPGQGRTLREYSYEDSYNAPGSPVTTRGPRGTSLVLTSPDGRSIYFEGQGASPEGDRPFLDRVDLATGKAQRLWRSEAPYFEEVVTVLDPAARRLLTRRESVDEPPNYFVRDLGRQSIAQVTSFADPAPQFKGLKGELVRYRRADGVELSGRLYLPPGYDATRDGPLPFLLWAYPREFRSAAAAAQVTGSPHRFTRPGGSSHLFLLTQGYGILDGPSMPIVGEGDAEPNDTYVEQLVASAQAAVDKIVDLGVADRDRIAVGGHSYGAFMTANLLAHSQLFRAGIARSGAYNRTLTPFGFQAEERPYWEAQEIYHRMSPFTYADRVSAPILLIHGMADNNSGTFPMQSERFYAALKGNGKVVRYIQLPAESHGYQARESVGHTLWEMVHWLDTHVKAAKPAAQ